MARAAGNIPKGLADAQVMVLTTPAPRCGRSLKDVVAECVEAGAGTVQLRDKEADARSLADTGRSLLAVTEPAGVPLIINDRIDVALAIGAQGVHLGPRDLPVAAARKLAPSGFLIGHSTDSPAAAVRAVTDGADYLGVGAVYGTRSKRGLEDERIGPEGVARVAAAVSCPVFAIGGVTSSNAPDLVRIGARLAVLSFIMDAERPGDAVQNLRNAGKRLLRGVQPQL